MEACMFTQTLSPLCSKVSRCAFYRKVSFHRLFFYYFFLKMVNCKQLVETIKTTIYDIINQMHATVPV